MSVDIGTVTSPWTQDAQGYLLTPTGVKAARIDSSGVVWLWDHKAKREYPLTPTDVRLCAERMGAKSQ